MCYREACLGVPKLLTPGLIGDSSHRKCWYIMDLGADGSHLFFKITNIDSRFQWTHRLSQKQVKVRFIFVQLNFFWKFFSFSFQVCSNSHARKVERTKWEKGEQVLPLFSFNWPKRLESFIWEFKTFEVFVFCHVQELSQSHFIIFLLFWKSGRKVRTLSDGKTTEITNFSEYFYNLN